LSISVAFAAIRCVLIKSGIKNGKLSPFGGQSNWKLHSNQVKIGFLAHQKEHVAPSASALAATCYKLCSNCIKALDFCLKEKRMFLPSPVAKLKREKSIQVVFWFFWPTVVISCAPQASPLWWSPLRWPRSPRFPRRLPSLRPIPFLRSLHQQSLRRPPPQQRILLQPIRFIRSIGDRKGVSTHTRRSLHLLGRGLGTRLYIPDTVDGGKPQIIGQHKVCRRPLKLVHSYYDQKLDRFCRHARSGHSRHVADTRCQLAEFLGKVVGQEQR